MTEQIKNSNLTAAKQAKNDEFYTQYIDIEREMQAYLDYDENAFRGKTILLPCDDPEWSNFTKYFAQNFHFLGIKKLISTSYAHAAKLLESGYEPSDSEKNSPQYDADKSKVKGKIFTLTGQSHYKDLPNNNCSRKDLFCEARILQCLTESFSSPLARIKFNAVLVSNALFAFSLRSRLF